MEYAGFDTIIEQQTSAGPPAVWRKIAQVKDLDGPGGEASNIEVSHRDDPWRRYVGGMLDGGEVTFDVVFDPFIISHDPTDAQSLWGMMTSRTMTIFRITFPGEEGDVFTATFNGFVQNIGTSSPLEDGRTQDITIKISGDVTWAEVPAP